MTLVALRDILESDSFQRNKNALRMALGRDVTGHPITTSMENMPHLLIAGTTGSGKSVCVNSILTSFLMYNTPDDLRMILVDPKRVELTGYNGIPHLLSPVVVEIDRVIGALQWMTRAMDKRSHMFAQVGSRNIADYNTKMKLQGGKKLPFLVIVIDELADLMLVAPGETEQTITRLAQLARAPGTKLEGGRVRLNKGIGNLADAVTRVIQEHQIPISTNKITLDFSAEPGLPPIEYDTEKIEQLIQKFVADAVKLTPPKGAIDVRVRKVALVMEEGQEPSDFLLVSVFNSGPPISKAELPLIFDRYRNVLSENKDSHTAGLGLIICQRIIDAHNGKIWVESDGERGATFFFALPLR